MPVSMHSTLTLPVLLETKRKFPGIRVHMTDGFDSFLHDQLRDGFADVGVLVYGPDLHIPGVDQQPIAIDRLMLSGRHPIDVEGPLTPSKIAHLPLAMPNQRSGIGRKLDAAF
jgi:DNA-binding transcriptional LysR family regulator